MQHPLEGEGSSIKAAEKYAMDVVLLTNHLPVQEQGVLRYELEGGGHGDDKRERNHSACDSRKTGVPGFWAVSVHS